MVGLIKRLRVTMLKRSLPQASLLTGFAFAIVAVSSFVAPSSLSAAKAPHPVAMWADRKDTGKIVALAVGQQLVVKLPIHAYRDDTWKVTHISPALKLIAGPDELRPAHWSPWKLSFQIFYFQRQSPGRVNLVMEENYTSKPMILTVVDQ
jgi:hypothetical protein